MTASTVSSRPSRAAASRSAQSSAGNGNTPTTPAPEPAPKPLSVYGQFLKELAAIFAGRVSKPEDLYCPPARMRMHSVIVVGTIQDPVTRELFSLSFRLKEQAEHLPAPRNADQVRTYSRQTKDLEDLAAQTRDLAWAAVKSELPASVGRDSLVVIDGWVVVRKPELEDRLREEAGSRGITDPKQVEEYVTTRLNKHYAQETEIGFEELESGHRQNRRSPDSLLSMLENLVGEAGFGR